MELDVYWWPPLPLRGPRRGETVIYACDAFDNIPIDPGVYVFGRRHGMNIEATYIGKAENLSRRLAQDLDTVHIMRALEAAPNGARLILFGVWTPRQNQRAAMALPVMERALIKYALAEGHPLVNVQGTRTPVHTVHMGGNRDGTPGLFKRKVQAEAR